MATDIPRGMSFTAEKNWGERGEGETEKILRRIQRKVGDPRRDEKAVPERGQREESKRKTVELRGKKTTSLLRGRE